MEEFLSVRHPLLSKEGRPLRVRGGCRGEAIDGPDRESGSAILENRDKPPLPLLGKEGITEILHGVYPRIAGVQNDKLTLVLAL